MLSPTRSRRWVARIAAAAALVVPALGLSIVPAHASTTATVLGSEFDKCSGQLSVRNASGVFVAITRGHWTTVNVTVDGDGFWHWRCGSSNERSRGEDWNMFEVDQVRVLHSTENRDITWVLLGA